MDHFETSTVIWAFSGIQALGLATAWLSRVSEGSILQPVFQRLFLICLLAAGVATMAAPQLGGGFWMVSAATLGVMILVAVCDFQQTDRAFTV